MEHLFQISLHEHRKEIILQRLSKKKLYLEKKTGDLNTSLGYKKILSDEIGDIEFYINSAETFINELIELNEKIGQEQFTKGYERCRKDKSECSMGGIPNKYFDKEAYRAWHESQIKNKWEDHY